MLAEAIWASLADPARLNEAAALPRHEIEEIAKLDGAVRYFGPLRLWWREQPVNGSTPSGSSIAASSRTGR